MGSHRADEGAVNAPFFWYNHPALHNFFEVRMGITKRFLLIPAAGLLLTALAWPVGLHLPVFVISNLAAVGLYFLDFFLTPAPREALSAEREFGHAKRWPAEKLYYKTGNDISFRVRNRTRDTLTVQARDGITDRHFTVTAENTSHTLPPNGEVVFSYTATPSKRGAFLFPHIYLRYNGLLSLCVRQFTCPCPGDYKVYPNLKDLGRYRLMTQKNRLLPPGEKTVKLPHSGAEFESLRQYVDGDDYRKINWMATARENRVIVNQYQAEKNQPVFILLDAGRAMSYTANGYKKLDYAINAALILSDIVNRQGDNSGLLVFDETVRSMIMPGKGAAHRNKMMETLYHIPESRSRSDYEGAFRHLCEKQKRRALVFIFTDFEILEEAEALTAHIAALRKRHLPIVTFMKNDNAEALAEQEVYGRKDKILRNTAREYLEERKKIFRLLNAMRVPNMETEAERFTAAAVNKYLAIQARRV
jgi:uncharacterized protein (DUF58 family)